MSETPIDPERAGTSAHSSSVTDALSAPRRLRSRIYLPAFGLLVLALIAAAVFFGWKWKEGNDRDAARNDALSAARASAAAIATYDYRDLDEYFAAVEDLATGDFAEQYDEANGNLRKVLQRTKAVVVGKVLDAGVQSMSDDKAVVLIFVDQHVKNSVTRGNATDRNRMLMTLERHGDRWLVQQVELL